MDRALDGIVVEIDAAIFEESDESVPPQKRVADRFAQAALGADLPAACFEEPVEVVDNRAAALVTNAETVFPR